LKKSFLFSTFVFTFITLFCALGTWQLYRLQWKQELIIQIDEGLKSAPTRYSNRIKNNYQRVFLEGRYDFKNQIYLYSLNQKGQPGFDVITSFETQDGVHVLINRGWINKEMKNKAEINLSNKKKIYGLLRKIPKKNIFKPDNDIKENFWFSIDINQIQETMGKKFNKHVVFLEDKKVDTPRPKKITINISNNHLKYAITWYSISVSIFFYFLYFRRYQ